MMNKELEFFRRERLELDDVMLEFIETSADGKQVFLEAEDISGMTGRTRIPAWVCQEIADRMPRRVPSDYSYPYPKTLTIPCMSPYSTVMS